MALFVGVASAAEGAPFAISKRDYEPSVTSHPNEHALELPYSALLELQTALHRMGNTGVRDEHSDFIIIYPVPPRPAK